MKRQALVILALMAAHTACASPNPEEAAREALEVGEKTIRKVVREPARAERAILEERRIAAALDRFSAEVEEARHETMVSNTDYDASRSALAMIDLRLSERRLALYEEALTATLAMRKTMTREEWAEFVARSRELAGRRD